MLFIFIILTMISSGIYCVFNFYYDKRNEKSKNDSPTDSIPDSTPYFPKHTENLSSKLLHPKEDEAKKFNVNIKYYRLYLCEINSEIEILENSIFHKDWEQIRKTAHKLKGGAQILKEETLVEILFEIEKLSENEETYKICEKISCFKKHIAELKERLKNEDSIG